MPSWHQGAEVIYSVRRAEPRVHAVAAQAPAAATRFCHLKTTDYDRIPEAGRTGLELARAH